MSILRSLGRLAGVFIGFLRLVAYSLGSWARFRTLAVAIGVLLMMTIKGRAASLLTWLTPLGISRSLKLAALYGLAFAGIVTVLSLWLTAYTSSVQREALARAVMQAERAQAEAIAKQQRADARLRQMAAEAEKSLRDRTSTASDDQLNDMLARAGALAPNNPARTTHPSGAVTLFYGALQPSTKSSAKTSTDLSTKTSTKTSTNLSTKSSAKSSANLSTQPVLRAEEIASEPSTKSSAQPEILSTPKAAPKNTRKRAPKRARKYTTYEWEFERYFDAWRIPL